MFNLKKYVWKFECRIYIYFIFLSNHNVYILIAHPIVDERIKHRVCHRQPVEAEIDVLSERRRGE